MKNKYWYIAIIIISFIYLVLVGKSFAKSEDEEHFDMVDLSLKITDNIEEDIIKYTDLIDDSLIPLATYDKTAILSDNYEFLVNFAINFILNNISSYKDSLIVLDEYIYNDGYNIYRTNQYVDLDVIYNITKKVFNKSDFLILNNYLTVNNGLVPLLQIDDYTSSMTIEKIIDIVSDNDSYVLKVKYKNLDIIYKYFYIKTIDDTLVLNNLEIEM